MHLERIKPIEEVRSVHPVKFDQIADQMFIYHCGFNSSHGKLMKNTFGLFAMTNIGHVFTMDGMEISAFDPARMQAGLLERLRRIVVRFKYQALRMGYSGR